MLVHLIQSRELFGPPERQEELKECWRRNEGVFDEYSSPMGRLTFTELFAMCKPGVVNVLMNSDLYMERLSHYPKPGEVWALSRHDVDRAGVAALWNHGDSADTWIVNGCIKDVDVPWPMGIPGVDNRLAWELRAAGYKVTNPSKTVVTYHLHLSNYRSYLHGSNGSGRGGYKLFRVPPPYDHVEPIEL